MSESVTQELVGVKQNVDYCSSCSICSTLCPYEALKKAPETGKIFLEIETAPEEPLCEGLKGWLIVSHWKGLGSAEHYDFCSFSCIKSWLDAQVPRIPEVFLESFKEDEK